MSQILGKLAMSGLHTFWCHRTYYKHSSAKMTQDRKKWGIDIICDDGSTKNQQRCTNQSVALPHLLWKLECHKIRVINAQLSAPVQRRNNHDIVLNSIVYVHCKCSDGITDLWNEITKLELSFNSQKDLNYQVLKEPSHYTVDNKSDHKGETCWANVLK